VTPTPIPTVDFEECDEELDAMGVAIEVGLELPVEIGEVEVAEAVVDVAAAELVGFGGGDVLVRFRRLCTN
jgi:hypothetical protein